MSGRPASLHSHKPAAGRRQGDPAVLGAMRGRCAGQPLSPPRLHPERGQAAGTRQVTAQPPRAFQGSDRLIMGPVARWC